MDALTGDLSTRLPRPRDANSTPFSSSSQPLSPPLSREISRDSKPRRPPSPEPLHAAASDAMQSFSGPGSTISASFTDPGCRRVRSQRLPTSPFAPHGLSLLPDCPDLKYLWGAYANLHLDGKDSNVLVEVLLAKIESQRREIESLRGLSASPPLPHYSELAYDNRITGISLPPPPETFSLVLVDATAVTFRPELLSQGFCGGRQAAMDLSTSIDDLIRHDSPVKIWVFDKLAAYADARLAHEFLAGFNSFSESVSMMNLNRPTFEITETVRENLSINECRRLLIAGIQCSCQIDLLQEQGQDPPEKSVVLLASGASNDSRLRGHPYLRINSLVRKVDDGIRSRLNSNASSVKSTRATCRTDDRPLTPDADDASFKPRPQPAATKTNAPPPIKTWASAAAKAKPANNPLPKSAAAKPTAPVVIKVAGDMTIPRNKQGQRIDPPVPHKKEELDRVKKLKLCNVEFLRGGCPYGSSCTHRHDYKPTPHELRVLSFVARMAPCANRGECGDKDCIYGHICPTAEAKRGRGCIYGDSCNFPAELHNVDRTPVKVVKV